jgi:hypothetical protein
MPTRIIQGSDAPDAGGGSTWGMIGQGAQGLAALVGSAMQAQAADKAAKAAAAGSSAPMFGAPGASNDWKPDTGGSMDGFQLAPLRPPPAAPVATMPTRPVDAGNLGGPSGSSLNPFAGGAGSGDLGVPKLDLGALGDRSWNPYGNPTNATASREMGNGVWNRVGVANVLPQRFPSLFPSSSQYGGL